MFLSKDAILPILQVKTSKVYVRDTTLVSPYMLLLFGGEISVQHQVELSIMFYFLHSFQPDESLKLSYFL
jgi:ATP-dependent RNA helicase DHX29